MLTLNPQPDKVVNFVLEIEYGDSFLRCCSLPMVWTDTNGNKYYPDIIIRDQSLRQAIELDSNSIDLLNKALVSTIGALTFSLSGETVIDYKRFYEVWEPQSNKPNLIGARVRLGFAWTGLAKLLTENDLVIITEDGTPLLAESEQGGLPGEVYWYWTGIIKNASYQPTQINIEAYEINDFDVPKIPHYKIQNQNPNAVGYFNADSDVLGKVIPIVYGDFRNQLREEPYSSWLSGVESGTPIIAVTKNNYTNYIGASHKVKTETPLRVYKYSDDFDAKLFFINMNFESNNFMSKVNAKGGQFVYSFIPPLNLENSASHYDSSPLYDNDPNNFVEIEYGKILAVEYSFKDVIEGKWTATSMLQMHLDFQGDGNGQGLVEKRQNGINVGNFYFGYTANREFSVLYENNVTNLQQDFESVYIIKNLTPNRKLKIYGFWNGYYYILLRLGRIRGVRVGRDEGKRYYYLRNQGRNYSDEPSIQITEKEVGGLFLQSQGRVFNLWKGE